MFKTYALVCPTMNNIIAAITDMIHLIQCTHNSVPRVLLFKKLYDMCVSVPVTSTAYVTHVHSTDKNVHNRIRAFDLFFWVCGIYFYALRKGAVSPRIQKGHIRTCMVYLIRLCTIL